MIAEIVSHWSYDRDLAEKAADYHGVSSLKHYLVLCQDEPRVWHWFRDADGGWSPSEILTGENGHIELTGLGAVVSLEKLYGCDQQ